MTFHCIDGVRRSSERKLAAIRTKIGILFQGGALFDSMTVEENIAFPLREAGERNSKVIREKVREILEVIELEGEQKKMPVNLSGGMKKRVGLARSIRPGAAPLWALCPCPSRRRGCPGSGPGACSSAGVTSACSGPS